MVKPESIETTPEPTIVNDPYTTLTGTITYDPFAYKVTHEPVVVNHEELDSSVEEVNPLLGRALRMGVGLKARDFECSGSDLSNAVWDDGSRAICGDCLLEVSDAGN